MSNPINKVSEPLSVSIPAHLFNTDSHQLNISNSTSSSEPYYSTQSYQYSETYGYGLVDAAGAVAAAVGDVRFVDVPNYSSYYDWGLDAISAPEVWQQGLIEQVLIVI